MRRYALLAALTTGLVSCGDDAPPVTVEGVDPAPADGDLAPEAELQPGGDLTPEAELAPEPSLEPEGTLQPDSADA